MAWRGLTSQVLLIAILPISALLLVVTFGSLALHRSAMRSVVAERDGRTVRSAARALDEHLSHRAAAVHGLAARLEAGGTVEETLRSADLLLVDFDGGIVVYSGRGQQLGSVGAADFWPTIEPEIVARMVACEVPESATACFPTSIASSTTGGAIQLVVSRSGPGRFIVVGAFSVSGLAEQILGEAASDSQSRLVLVDAVGAPLFQVDSQRADGAPEQFPGVAEALRGESGTAYLSIAGTEYVVAYSSVASTGWALVLFEPWHAVSGPLLQFTAAAPLILVPVLLFTLAALWMSARQIVQPLKQLETQSAALEWGDYDAVRGDVGGIQEIQSLQRTLVHLADRIRRSQQGLRDYIGVITEAQEQERKRLARALHDDALQELIALNQQTQMLKRKSKDRTVTRGLEAVEARIVDLVQDLRRFTGALRPLYLEDLGLVAALQMLAQETGNRDGLSVMFRGEGAEVRLPDEIEIAIYRIAQEAISNVVKHAQAGSVELSLNYEGRYVLLEIRDNGVGFAVPESPSDLAHEGHFGLLGIFERSQLMGAKTEILSEPGRGTTILVSIPVPES